jgi:hypothetical protein
MSHAHVIANGSCEEIFSNRDMLYSAGLDVPEISNIIASLRKNGVVLPDNIYTVDGAINALTELYKQGQGGTL